MNDSEISNPFLPILLLILSVAVVLIWQVNNIAQQRSALQIGIGQLQEPTRQSQQFQGNLQRFLTDLLELAKTDPQAKAVVDKYGIRQQAPVSPTPPAP